MRGGACLGHARREPDDHVGAHEILVAHVADCPAACEALCQMLNLNIVSPARPCRTCLGHARRQSHDHVGAHEVLVAHVAGRHAERAQASWPPALQELGLLVVVLLLLLRALSALIPVLAGTELQTGSLQAHQSGDVTDDCMLTTCRPWGPQFSRICGSTLLSCCSTYQRVQVSDARIPD